MSDCGFTEWSDRFNDTVMHYHSGKEEEEEWHLSLRGTWHDQAQHRFFMPVGATSETWFHSVVLSSAAKTLQIVNRESFIPQSKDRNIQRAAMTNRMSRGTWQVEAKLQDDFIKSKTFLRQLRLKLSRQFVESIQSWAKTWCKSLNWVVKAKTKIKN